MSGMVEKIDEEIKSKSLLKHPFYKACSAGELAISQLAGYSMEYFQLVKKIPKFVANARSLSNDKDVISEISQNLREETEHIAPWIGFASSLRVTQNDLLNYKGSPDTNSAVSELESLTRLSFEEAVATLYAYEKELPEISRSKIDGLKRFYGMSSHDAMHYFEIHEVADIKHAEVWRSILRKVPKEKQELVLLTSILLEFPLDGRLP